jgi:predicted esterase
MTIRAHHLYVTRTARYCTLGEPGPGVRQLWLACHGYGQLAADLLAGFRASAAPDRLFVAPEALSRFYTGAEDGPHGPDSRVGATWMTREDRLAEIEDYVAYLDRVHVHVRRQLAHDAAVRSVALGFSQGTHTVARWAARTHHALDELVLWGGTLPTELDAAEVAPRWAGLRVTLVVGSRDRYVSEQQLRADEGKLEAAGIRVRALTFEGGHRLDDETLRRIAEP